VRIAGEKKPAFASRSTPLCKIASPILLPPSRRLRPHAASARVIRAVTRTLLAILLEPRPWSHLHMDKSPPLRLEGRIVPVPALLFDAARVCVEIDKASPATEIDPCCDFHHIWLDRQALGPSLS